VQDDVLTAQHRSVALWTKDEENDYKSKAAVEIVKYEGVAASYMFVLLRRR